MSRILMWIILCMTLLTVPVIQTQTQEFSESIINEQTYYKGSAIQELVSQLFDLNEDQLNLINPDKYYAGHYVMQLIKDLKALQSEEKEVILEYVEYNIKSQVISPLVSEINNLRKTNKWLPIISIATIIINIAIQVGFNIGQT